MTEWGEHHHVLLRQSLPLVVAFLASIFGCGGESDGAKCVPGASVGCVCPTGQHGAQTCAGSGTFGACVCNVPDLDAGTTDRQDAGGTTPPDVATTVDGPAGQLDAIFVHADVQPFGTPDAGLIATDAPPGQQPDVSSATLDAQLGQQPDVVMVASDTAPETGIDVPAPVATLTADRSSVDLLPNGRQLDGGAPKPIPLGTAGTATVVVTNGGSLASGALAVVAGPGLATSGCTGALAPGASCSLTISATPTVVGDFSSNVSIWATPGATAPLSIVVTATVVASPSIRSFVADPPVLPVGGSSTLTAVFSNGTGFIDHGLGAVASGVGVSTGSVTAATTFTLTVTNEFGDSVTAQIKIGTSSPWGVGPEPCSPAKDLSCANGNGSTGNFDSRTAFCFRTADIIAGWSCNNMDGWTMSVNGREVACTSGTVSSSTLPPAIYGIWYFQFTGTASAKPWASLSWYANTGNCKGGPYPAWDSGTSTSVDGGG